MAGNRYVHQAVQMAASSSDRPPPVASVTPVIEASASPSDAEKSDTGPWEVLDTLDIASNPDIEPCLMWI